MSIILIVIGAVLLWHVIGALGFAFWWTTEFDLTDEQLPLLFMAGILGPFSWLVGAILHSDRPNRRPSVYVRKRQ